MPIRKMDAVGEFNDLAQKVRSGTEALDDARYLLPSRICPPEVISCGSLSGSFLVLDNPDFCRLGCRLGAMNTFVSRRCVWSIHDFLQEKCCVSRNISRGA